MIPGIFFSIDRGSERASCGSRVERGKIFDSGDLYVLSFVTARITAMSHLSEWTLNGHGNRDDVVYDRLVCFYSKHSYYCIVNILSYYHFVEMKTR